jgi:hypothetical protein
MPNKATAHEIAAEMLNLPADQMRAMNRKLYDTITRAEWMIHNAGGELSSRQSIAAIIIAWELAHSNERAVV